MAKPLADSAYPGAHPTVGEFADLLTRWGFKPMRERRADPHHVSLRGPHGGRIQLLASLQGRADADQIIRAARLAHVAVDVFLAGPSTPDTAARPVAGPVARTIEEAPDNQPFSPQPLRSRPRRAKVGNGAGDSVVSLVLTTHVQHDRPMRFEEIVDLCGGRITRVQVRETSAHLCRAGHLDRICEGVYQWARGARNSPEPGGQTHSQADPQPSLTLVSQPARTEPVDELFGRIFPHGVQMTPQLWRQFRQWAELTQTLATHAGDSR